MAGDDVLSALISKLGNHFVGLWIYQPYGKRRMWCVTFRDVGSEYWETDLFPLPAAALRQAIRVVAKQTSGRPVLATGQKQIVR